MGGEKRRQLSLRDTPIGTDWPRYLGNAVAIGERRWQDYQVWRGPLHALLCLWLAPLGGLLEASQGLSMASVAVLLLTSAALGRRILGPGGGALTALLLAVWPDLPVQARMSTPYPLLAAWVAAGLWALDRATQGRGVGQTTEEGGQTEVGLRGSPAAGGHALRRWTWVILCFGLASATDARGLGLAAFALLGTIRLQRKFLWTPVGFAGIYAIRTAVLATVPVRLLSLAEQVALQRDLHAREGGIAGCYDHNAAPLQLSELWDTCAGNTLMANLGRIAPMSPLPVVVLVLLAAIGLKRRLLPIVIMALTLIPALLLVGVEHRYLLPFAGPVSLLFASGIQRAGLWLAARRRAAPTTTLAGTCIWFILLFYAGWHYHADTLIGRSPHPGGHMPQVQIVSPPAVSSARAWLRQNISPESRVFDCAGLSLQLLLYPHPVVAAFAKNKLSVRCQRLLHRPPSNDIFLLTNVPPNSDEWQTAIATPDGLMVLTRP